MDILIIADFCGKLDGNDNSRFLYLANLLSKDNDVEILTSDFDHSSKSYFTSVTNHFPFKITMVHEGEYKKNVSIRRFYGHYVWANSVKEYLEKRKKPDVVYAAVPPLLAPYFAAKYCEKRKIHFVIDIQDLWPEAFKMVFNIPIISDLIFAPFSFLANGIYKRADNIVAVSETYLNRALCVNKKCSKGSTVFLGTDLTIFDRFVKDNSVPNKGDNEVWLAYCGTLGASYDLNVVFEAMRLVNDKRLKFIVMGDGERKSEFEQNANGLNVLFTGSLPYGQMCGLLTSCDITINPIMPGAAQSIINKHADYAASGLPVLNTQVCKEYRDLVEKYQMGFNCKNNDANDLSEKLSILVNNKSMRLEMGRNARRCAEERFDRTESYKEILKIISIMV